MFGRDEEIEMVEKRHGYFPKVFAHGGVTYDVIATERCWTVERKGPLRGNIERYLFQVRARARSEEQMRGEEGTFVIYQDIQTNNWHMRGQVK